jgi:RNA polymerase sigma-70 factor, ECF subfamily
VELLKAVRSGPDDPAWALFLDRYEPVLLGVAERIGLDPDAAQDLSQQVLLEFVRDLRAGQFDSGRGRMRSWILGIARHRAVDSLRRRGGRGVRGEGRAREVHLGDADGNVPDATSLGSVLEAEWERELERRIASEAMERLRSSGLSATTLQAFELTVIRGVPAEAAAAQCSMSTDQVYVARSRVAARLRDVVAEIRSEWDDECGPTVSGASA